MTKASRPSSSGGLVWKSGLLSASLGAVLLGWGLLARAPAHTAPTAAPSVQPQVIVVRVPMQSEPGGGAVMLATRDLVQLQPNRQPAAPAALQLDPLPQKPVFQRPVTRTRRS